MLKTFTQSPMVKIVFLYATLLAQQQTCCLAADDAGSAPTPGKSHLNLDTVFEKLSDTFAKVAKKVEPSLVEVRPWDDKSTFDPRLAIPFEVAGTDVKAIESPGQVNQSETITNPGLRTGSGVIVTEDGYIWTSSEVMRDDKTASVKLANGDEYTAKLVMSDPVTGLVILKIDAVGLAPLELADTQKLRVADWAMALSHRLDHDPILSKGIVWLQDGAAPPSDSGADFFSYHFPAVRIEPGSVLVNQEGQLIGIDVPPPLLLKASAGARYGLTSSSALAIQQASLRNEKPPASDESTNAIVEAESREAVTNIRSAKLFEPRGSVPAHATRTSAFDEYPRLFSTNWIREPVSHWVEWLRVKLSSTSTTGGIDSKSKTTTHRTSG